MLASPSRAGYLVSTTCGGAWTASKLVARDFAEVLSSLSVVASIDSQFQIISGTLVHLLPRLSCFRPGHTCNFIKELSWAANSSMEMSWLKDHPWRVAYPILSLNPSTNTLVRAFSPYVGPEPSALLQNVSGRQTVLVVAEDLITGACNDVLGCLVRKKKVDSIGVTTEHSFVSVGRLGFQVK